MAKPRTGGGGFGSHGPPRRSVTPADSFSDRGRIGRTVSRDKVELGGSSSRSSSKHGFKEGKEGLRGLAKEGRSEMKSASQESQISRASSK